MNFDRISGLAAVVLGLWPGMASAEAMKLIPMPREVRAAATMALASGLRVVCSGCGAEDQFAAADLQQTLVERGVAAGPASGAEIELVRASGLPTGFDEAMRAEGYTITPTARGLVVTGVTAEGLFYGAQTVKQMVSVVNGRAQLEQATIRDWPAMRYRGLDDDLSRGPVVTLEFQKKMIRTLAAYKVNLYSPYFEQTMQYAGNPVPAAPNGSMSAADARALVEYARPYHVTIVPEQESFGHLRHTLVWEHVPGAGGDTARSGTGAGAGGVGGADQELVRGVGGALPGAVSAYWCG